MRSDRIDFLRVMAALKVDTTHADSLVFKSTQRTHFAVGNNL